MRVDQRAEIGRDSIIAKSDSFVESTVDDEAILMHLDQGSFSSIRSTGLRIWQLIEEPASVSTICESLRCEFDVGEEECHEQTIAFLSDLKQRGLITIAPGK